MHGTTRLTPDQVLAPALPHVRIIRSDVVVADGDKGRFGVKADVW